jgi:hypothetical protein
MRQHDFYRSGVHYHEASCTLPAIANLKTKYIQTPTLASSVPPTSCKKASASHLQPVGRSQRDKTRAARLDGGTIGASRPACIAQASGKLLRIRTRTRNTPRRVGTGAVGC